MIPKERGTIRLGEFKRMVSDRANITRKATDRVVKACFEIIEEEVMMKDVPEVVCTPIGKFHRRCKKSFLGRNPLTGERLRVPAREWLELIPRRKYFHVFTEEENASDGINGKKD